MFLRVVIVVLFGCILCVARSKRDRYCSMFLVYYVCAEASGVQIVLCFQYIMCVLRKAGSEFPMFLV